MAFTALKDVKVAIIGLGYVGLPLAVAFAGKYAVTGFDTSARRITELNEGFDRTREMSTAEIKNCKNLIFTGDADLINECNVYIVTVPTPVDRQKRPDLSHLIAASTTVGTVISPGDVVIYESTVYPGATTEECLPVIEEVSGLTCNRDFFAGYSPERINPGDRERRVETIVKITSGSTPEAAEFVDTLYRPVITAGTHKASSMRVAEAAKIIENTQRDMNIALINEFAMIFNKLGIDTSEVLAAAGTKWNFLNFRPGLVGGHCTGVDPYYLTHKAQSVGIHPEIVLAGRRINDGMGTFVTAQLIKKMIRHDIAVSGARVLVMGLTFKENCPDIRNTRVIDIIHQLEDYKVKVDVYDPWVDRAGVAEICGITPIERPEPGTYDAIFLAVGHRQFIAAGAPAIRAHLKPGGILYDLKGIFPKQAAEGRL